MINIYKFLKVISHLFKMSVPTEHFEKIPVYTLSPVPLSPEVLEALKVYER